MTTLTYQRECIDLATATQDEIENEYVEVEKELKHIEHRLHHWQGCKKCKPYLDLLEDRAVVRRYYDRLKMMTIPF